MDTDGLRSTALYELRSVLSTENWTGAIRCAVRLYDALPDGARPDRNVVMVAYGGGKDSSYTLAFVRAMQLILHQLYGETFRMRVATNRHAGMPRAVMENIDRAYRALRLPEDPGCELLLVDHDRIGTFDVAEPHSPDVVARNRTDILMTGHRTAADARPTFCNACNLSMANSFGLAAAHDGGVDLIITGDSRREQRDYHLWVARLARRFGLQPKPGERTGFKGFLTALDNISQAYFADIHGVGSPAVADHAITTGVRTGLTFFSIYDDTAYASGDHWELLTEFLGFRFDDIAFSFTESDCANPALMAHLRALKCERLYGRSYADGLDEYTEFALGLMRSKEFPPQLMDIMRARYRGPGAADRMRATAAAYAEDAYGLTEEHLVAMVHAPFTEKAAGLDAYLNAEQPELAARAHDIRRLLEGGGNSDTDLAERLEHLSGLTIAQLRVLHQSNLRLPSTEPVGGELIDAILAGDPHKEVIATRHSAEGPLVSELLSGR